MMTFDDLRCKEIININTGEKIGYADDMGIDEACAKICTLIVRGRCRWFGLFGREDDIVVKWSEIQKIGDDTILVTSDCKYRRGEKKRKHSDKYFS